MDAFEYIFWGLIIYCLSSFLIGAIMGVVLVIGLIISPEKTLLCIEKFLLLTESLNERYTERYNPLELKSEPSSVEVVE